MNLFENIVNRKPVFANKDFRNTTDTFGSASGFFGKTPTAPQTYTQKAPTQFGTPTPIIEKPKMTLFSDEYTMLGKMKADGLSDDESMNLITQRRKDLLNGKVMIDAQEKEMLRKMQADNVSAKEATAMIAQRRKDKEKEQFNKAYESGNLLQKGAYNFLALGAGNLETIAKYSGNALDFATGGKLGFGEEVKKMEEVTQSPQFQESTAFKAGTYLPDVALAVSPIGGGYMAGAKGMTGLQGANLFSKVGLKNVSQGLMARSGVVGAGFGATQPIFEKGSEATVGDIASGAGYGATFGALGAPVFGKAFKYGQAGYYGGATGMGKSIARDIKGAGQTAKTIGNAIKPSGANISTRANRFNALDEQKFIQATGQTPGEFATTRGMTKVGDDAVVEATNAWQASKAQADDAFGAIEGNFRYTGKGDDLLKTTIDDLDTRLINTKSPDAPRIQELKAKYDNTGLTMSEINEIKRTYANNYKYSFLEQGSEGALRSKNLQDAIRKWQFKVAEQNGLSNIAEINKNTQAWKMYADSLAKKLNRGVANNANTLTDWIALSGGSPENIALYLGKKLASSNAVKRGAIKLFSKQTKPSIIKANKAEIQQSNFQKNVNRGISGNRDSSGGESMVRVKGLLPAGTKEAKIAQEEAIARQKAKKESTEQAKAILAKQKAQKEALKSPDITSKSIIRQPEGYTKKVTPTPVKEVIPKKITPTEGPILYHGARDATTIENLKKTGLKGVTEDQRGLFGSTDKSLVEVDYGKNVVELQPTKKVKVFNEADALKADSEWAVKLARETGAGKTMGGVKQKLKEQGYDVFLNKQGEYEILNEKAYKVVTPTEKKSSFEQAKEDILNPEQRVTERGIKQYRELILPNLEGHPTYYTPEQVKEISNLLDKRLAQIKKVTSKDPTKTTVNLQQSKGGFIRLPGFTSKLNTKPQPKRLFAGENSAQPPKSKTGWFKGADGKMRFEIDDSKSSILTTEKWNDAYNGKSVDLGSLLKHDELYKQYPELKDNVIVKFTNKESGGSLKTENGVNFLELNKKLFLGKNEDIKSTLLHEIQHAIQNKEGFARGGTINSIVSDGRMLKEDKISYENNLNLLSDIAEKMAIKNNDTTSLNKIGSYKELIEFINSKKYFSDSDKKLANSIKKQGEEIANIKETKNLSNADYYKSLAGEVEARNVQARMNMNKAERAKTSPIITEEKDVPRAKQIIRMDSKGPSLLKIPEIGKKSDLIPVFRGQSHKDFTAFEGEGKQRFLPGMKGTSFSKTLESAKNYGDNIVEGYVDRKSILQSTDISKDVLTNIKRKVSELEYEDYTEGYGFEEIVSEIAKLAESKGKSAIDLTDFFPSSKIDDEIRIINKSGFISKKPPKR